MIAVFNAQGTLLSLSHQQVFQGSNKANAIEIIAPIVPSAIVKASFTLPNGKITKPVPVPLGVDNGFLGFQDENGNQLYRWSWEIISAITAYVGVVSVHITAKNGSQTIANYSFEFEVLDGSVPTETPVIDDYAELMSYLETQFTAVSNNLITLDNKFKNFWQLAGSLPFAYDIDNLQAGSYYASLSSGNINVPASGILYALSSSVPKLQILFGVDNYIYQRSKTSNDTTWSEWFKSTSQVEVNSLQSQITELVNRLNNLVIGGQTDIFIIVDELPEEGYANKIYLVPIADGETPNVFDEYLWVYTHWEYFGRSSLNLDLSEYVKFTDYATADKAGVVKGTVYASQGVFIKPDGTLQTVYATDNEITNKSSYYKIICPKNMDHAWKVSATTNTEEWRNEDKTAACETIGAVRPLYVDNLIAQCGTWTPITISESNIELNVNENGGTFTKYLSDFSIKYNAKLRLLNVTGRIRIDTTSGWVGTPTVYVNITHLKSSIGNINTDTKFSAVQFILANNSNQLQQNEGAVLIVDNTQFKAVAIETFQNRRDAGKYCFVFNNTIPY